MSIEVYKGEMETMVSQGAALIDVREPDELAQNDALPGHLHLPLSRLGELAGYVKPNQPVIFYCRSGVRAYQAAQIAEQHLTQPAYYLAGGLLGYLDA